MLADLAFVLSGLRLERARRFVKGHQPLDAKESLGVIALAVGGPAPPHFQFRPCGRRRTAMPNTVPRVPDIQIGRPHCAFGRTRVSSRMPMVSA